METTQDLKWVRMGEFLAMNFPHQTVIGNDLLDGGEKLCIFGPSEAGKSYWLIQLALNLSTGTPFLGYPIPVRQTVLILQSELSPRRYQERLAKLAGVQPFNDNIREDFLYRIGKFIPPFLHINLHILNSPHPDVVVEWLVAS